MYFFAYSIHSRIEFEAIVGFGGRFNVGQQCERERRMPTTMPYVAICAAFDCITSMLMLTFLQKWKFCLITSISSSNTSFVDGQLAPLMATCNTLKSVKLLMLLWLLPFAVHRMAWVMLQLTSLVIKLATPSLKLMTN